MLTLGLAEAAMHEGSLDEAADLLTRAVATADQQAIMPIVTKARALVRGLDARGFRSASIVDSVPSINETLALQAGVRS